MFPDPRIKPVTRSACQADATELPGWPVFQWTADHIQSHDSVQKVAIWVHGPRQANLVLIAYASSEGSGESYKQWVKRNLQTESQIPGPSEWLYMRSWNLSWRNARRHKFAWRGSYNSLNSTMLYMLMVWEQRPLNPHFEKGMGLVRDQWSS